MDLTIKNQLEKEPKYWITKTLTLLGIMIIVVWSMSSIEFKGVQKDGAAIANNIVKGILSPDTNLLLNFTKQGIPYLLLETAAIALLATVIGSVIAIPFAFVASTNIGPKWLSALGIVIIAAIRTFPSFVYGLMFIRVTGPGPFAGVLTLSIASIGMVSKLYIEVIEDLDKKILESLDAAGCNSWQKIRCGILPQLSTNFISTAIYRFEINIKDAAVLGLVGAGGIGAPLIFAMNSYKWSQVGAILVGLIILVLIVEYASTKIRTKLARG